MPEWGVSITGISNYDPNGHVGPDEIYISRYYACLGAGAGFGWKWKLGQQLFIRYSIGFQYIGRFIEQNIDYHDHDYTFGSGGILPGDSNWWFGGPGSMLIFKLGLGFGNGVEHS